MFGIEYIRKSIEAKLLEGKIKAFNNKWHKRNLRYERFKNVLWLANIYRISYKTRAKIVAKLSKETRLSIPTIEDYLTTGKFKIRKEQTLVPSGRYFKDN